MNTHDLNFKRRAFKWWDELTLSQKAWYGQIYPDLTHKTELVYRAYKDFIKDRSHLKVIK